MHVAQLRTENFRGLAELVIDLAPRFNLLLGDNQSGKTATLDAIAIGLSCFFLGFRTGRAQHIQKTDARLALRRLGDSVQMPAQYPVKIDLGVDVDGQRLWETLWRTGTGGHQRPGRDFLRELGGRLDERMQRGDEFDLPVIDYFGTERISRHRNTRRATAEKIQDRSLGYKDCLERDSNFRLIEDWIARQTHAQIQQESRGLLRSASTALGAIERAVCRCVPDVKQFFYDFDYRDLTMVFADGRRLPWPMLSDGVRSLAMLAMDIAWRASVLNPHHGVDAPERATGVVLIDEIDLALHPHWQRRVVGDLRRAFPNLQFIATTHSPQILASLATSEEARVIELRDGGASRRQTYGMDSNAILTDVMNTPERPEEVAHQLAHVNELIDADRTKEAEQEIQRLEDRLGSDDTALVRLRAELRFLHRPSASPKQD